MAWQIFATKTSPNPMSTLDTQSSNLSAFGIVDCTASGTNVITLTPILSGYTGPAYANNVKYGFLAANTTNGVVTLKVGSLAAINVYQLDGTTQLTTGDIVSGQYYVVAYNAALNSAAGGWVVIAGTVAATLSAATQANQETGTSTTTYVSPGRQQFHASAAKSWVYVTYSGGVPAATASYNVTSLTDTGTGICTVVFTTNMSTANYCVVAGTGNQAASNVCDTGANGTGFATTGYALNHWETAGTLTDPNTMFGVAFGDQ